MQITSRFGKSYNNEKAVISLTSWTARIATVGLTIYNLRKMCPQCHIALTLSEQEFPHKEADLPYDLRLMAKTGILEILWVYKNYKSLKKVLGAMSVFPNIPVISADDDCLYICNYADILYNKWLENTNSVVKYTNHIGYNGTQGPSTLYPPTIFPLLINAFNRYETEITNKFSGMDDAFLSDTIIASKTPIIACSPHYCFRFHNENGAIHPNLNTLPIYKECYSDDLTY